MGTDNKLKISFISVNFDFYNRPMEWTTAHDVLLCREIFLTRVLHVQERKQ